MNQALSPNTNLSHYCIVSKIGEGGMGEVWLAEDTRLERKVALKILPAAFTQDAERVRRFMQEAKAASALNHPNIVTVHDIGESDVGHFIVMEVVAGRTLRVVTAEDNTTESLLTLGTQMAKALSAAHAAGITHRDIKPDNIMVRDDGYVKLLDFGLARLLPANSGDSEAATLAQRTVPGTIMGTVAYMSPEQARGEVVSHPSDVFALGIVFYELATGRHPFKAETMVGYLHAITLQTPAPPQQWQPKLPDAVNGLLLRMLAKEASQRPTASEVAQTLQEIERKGYGESGWQREGESVINNPQPAIRRTVGREPERDELRAAFNAAQNGRGSLLCVAGEPGIGKTTLVEDFLTELSAQEQCTIARGRCSERLAGTEAYLPLLEALESLLAQKAPLAVGQDLILHYTQKMKQLAPTWYAQVAPLSGDSEESARLLAEVKAASQERMKRELANFLTAVAQAKPLVIFFDDLHWADVSTIDLLSFLAGKFDGLRVLIIVTYRPSDMLLSKHPFLQIKPDLQARGVCRELLLEFLNEAEIAEYLALEFPGHRFPPEFPQLIHAKTEGSPLFMADLVRYLRDRGVIAAEDSGRDARAPRWTLAQSLPDIERELPESVRGMIERKIAQLSEEDRKLLTCASVQGYEFDSAILAQVLKLDADEVEERLEKLERVFAFVKLTSEAEFPNRTLTLKYRFVHVLYQNALYAGLRATRKATLSRDVAQTLENLHGAQRAAVANELALLWEAAREYARAGDYFLQAAHNAAQGNAQREAVQLARRGLEALFRLPETPERDSQELGLQLTLGFSLTAVGGFSSPELEQTFVRVQKLCQHTTDDLRVFAALFGLWGHYLVRTEFAQAEQQAKQLLQLSEQSPSPAPLVVGCIALGETLLFQGQPAAALVQFERGLAIYTSAPEEAYLSFTIEEPSITLRRDLACALWMLGHSEQAWKRAEEALALAARLSHPYSQCGAHLAASAISRWGREWERCRVHGEKSDALAQEYDLGDFQLGITLYHQTALAYQTQPGEGIQLVRRAFTVTQARGFRLIAITGQVALAELLGMAGQIAEGLAEVAETLTHIERSGERFWEAELWRTKGELLLKAAADQAEASRAQAEAERCYQQAIEIARQQQAKLLELRAATSLARLWQQQGKREEARQMLAEIYGWFTEGFATADLIEAKALLDELQS